jgi:MYXO-CTERM domain-containing protein
MASAEKTLSTGSPIPDAGIPDAGAPDGGTNEGSSSGCAIGSTPTPGAPLLALLFLAAFLIRRRKA